MRSTTEPRLQPARRAAAAKTKADTGSARLTQILAGLSGLVALACVFSGLLMLIYPRAEAGALPLLGLLCVLCQGLSMSLYLEGRQGVRQAAAIAAAAFGAILLLEALPLFVTGLQVNAVVRHSVFSALLLFCIGMPALAAALLHFYGGTPRAEDISHYPLIVVPVLVAVIVYFALIARIFVDGLPGLRWDLITTSFSDLTWPTKGYMADGWPYWYFNPIQNAGLLNHIRGTLNLMVLTCLFAAPFGIGAGVYLAEYGQGRLGQVIRLSISTLRGFSLLILGLTAYAIATATFGTPLARIFNGYYFDAFGEMQISQGGSFITAALVLAFLVIPVITRSTEEGCRSLPPDLRDGSLALGASEAHTLRRVVLPWSLPNIVTGLILSCAEAAGSVTVIMLIAGRGQFGAGMMQQATSLAYFIYDSQFGNLGFQKIMKPYQGSAAVLLLLVTMGLGVVALLTKRWLVRRYRGG